jgi:hypothetical protein
VQIPTLEVDFRLAHWLFLRLSNPTQPLSIKAAQPLRIKVSKNRFDMPSL